MSHHHLSNDQFLDRLAALFGKTHSRSHGSVFLTQKPIRDDSNQPAAASPIDSSQPDLERRQPVHILIRATNGKSKKHRQTDSKARPTADGKEKLSTIVELGAGESEKGLEEFYAKYAEVCKKGMEGLRKRDRKKGKKKKDKAKRPAAGVAATVGKPT